MGSNNIFEEGNVVSILYPSDIQTKVTADYIDMADNHALEILFFKGVTTSGDDPVLTIQQATSNAGAGAKDLNVDFYYLKSGTLLSTSSIGGQFTKTTLTASNVITGHATSAEEQQLLGIHIEADMLDVSGGFQYVTVNVADTGTNAHYGCILGVLIPGRYKQESAPNPLD